MNTLRAFAILPAACMLLCSCVWLGDQKPLFEYPDDDEVLESPFGLLCWNVGKGKYAQVPVDDGKDAVARDLSRILSDMNPPEIICLQEGMASLVEGDRREILGKSVDDWGAHFGRSFRWLFGESNGVITFATVKPSGTPRAVASTWKEGWVLTPKCSLITRYPLRDRDGGTSELLVVNFHGLVFQLFFSYMLERQIEEIVEMIEHHEGPAIICGDFNTWRHNKMKVVREALSGYEEIEYDKPRRGGEDYSKWIGGDPEIPLDHIYYRGLEPVGPGVVMDEIRSSDHDPIIARFRR